MSSCSPGRSRLFFSSLLLLPDLLRGGLRSAHTYFFKDRIVTVYLGMFVSLSETAPGSHTSIARTGGGVPCTCRGRATRNHAATRLSQRGGGRPRSADARGPLCGACSTREGFFCFRLVFSFRPVAAGGAGWGIKGQAPPFGECDTYACTRPVRTRLQREYVAKQNNPSNNTQVP